MNQLHLANSLSLIVPVVTAIVLSVGYDIVSLIRLTEEVEMTRSMLVTDMVVSDLLLLSGLFLAVWISQMFVRRLIRIRLAEPLGKLSEGMEQIRQGNYEFRIHYEDSDPNCEIYEDFNEMATETYRMHVKDEQVDAGRRELLLSVSHDMRSPLTSIIAYVQGLLDGIAQTPEDQSRYLNTIKDKALDIQKMVNQLFLYAKLETGNYQGETEVFDVAQALRELVGVVKEEYEQKGLFVELDRCDAGEINADPQMFQRICINLMDNSCKYKNKDKGILRISVISGKKRMKIVFEDNGPGVSEEALPHLWDVFYRGDQARSNPRMGSGIGLAIVKRAVDSMGGKIVAKNGENGGLIMTLRVPKQGQTEGVDR